MSAAIEQEVLTDDDFRDAARSLFKAKKIEGFMPVALHLYRADDGTPAYGRVRMHKPHPSRPKGREKFIRPFWHDGTRWTHGEPPQPDGKLLYGLHELATLPDSLVAIVEGEQKADFLTQIGAGKIIGVTAGGASSAGAADWRPMAGRHVLLWADNDEPGAKYASEVCSKLLMLGCTVEHLDAAALALPKKGDVMDWCEAFRLTYGRLPTADDVLALPRAQSVGPGPSGGVEEAISWRPIKPLPRQELAAVEQFDLALLPERLRPWAADIAERMQCPADFVGASIMASLGIVIGRRVGIRPKAHDDWTEYANQWLCIVGRPSVMKSPSMAAALAPLKRLQAEAIKDHDFQMEGYREAKDLYEMRKEATQKQIKDKLKKNPTGAVDQIELDEPELPLLRRYLVNDATAEVLLEICVENPQGVGVFRDELVSLLKSMDREGQEAARGFYLTGWNGNDSYTVDRIGRGRNNRAEAVCISLIGSTQPGRISEYLREAVSDGAANDGLMQRFGMLVWPDIPPNWEDVDKYPDAAKKNAAFDVFQRLDAADPVTDWGAEIVLDHAGQPEEGTPPFLRLDAAALGMFREWRAEWETSLRSGELHPAIESHFAKYRKLVPSLALVCHLADGGRGPVTAEAMVRGLAWSEYLKSHALRAYGASMTTPVDRARALLKKIQEGKLPLVPFSLKHVYRNEWSMLTNREDAAEAVCILVEHGYLVERDDQAKGERGGRPREQRYAINPEAQS
ncbi:YfjI family protein [Cupriavidus basilensis]|uniref:YfjI family protein n=1 Tax=Cupriavidus basilensis TaxID=68895 RepID=UPI00157AB693|nr:YfjI family protein [Cupriavidus basilensis]